MRRRLRRGRRHGPLCRGRRGLGGVLLAVVGGNSGPGLCPKRRRRSRPVVRFACGGANAVGCRRPGPRPASLGRARLRQGAFATFLGIVLADSPRPTPARADARGARGEGFLPLAGGRRGRHLPDAHPRGVLLRAFPLKARPVRQSAAPCRLADAGRRGPAAAERCGPTASDEPGDRLWAMTDALAQWCLAAQRERRQSLERVGVAAGRTPDAQREFVAMDRAAPRLAAVEERRRDPFACASRAG